MGNKGSSSSTTEKISLAFGSEFLCSKEYSTLKDQFAPRRDGRMSKEKARLLVKTLSKRFPGKLHGDEALRHIDELPGETASFPALVDVLLGEENLTQSAAGLRANEEKLAGKELTVREMLALKEADTGKGLYFETQQGVLVKDVLRLIFGKLTLGQLNVVALVCKQFANIATAMLSALKPPRVFVIQTRERVEFAQGAQRVLSWSDAAGQCWSSHASGGRIECFRDGQFVASHENFRWSTCEFLPLGDYIFAFNESNPGGDLAFLHVPSNVRGRLQLPAAQQNVFRGEDCLFALSPHEMCVYEFRIAKKGGVALAQDDTLVTSTHTVLNLQWMKVEESVAAFPNVLMFRSKSHSGYLEEAVVYDSTHRRVRILPCGGFVPVSDGSLKPTLLSIRPNLLFLVVTASTFVSLGELCFLRLEEAFGYWSRCHITAVLAAQNPVVRRFAPDQGWLEFSAVHTRSRLLICVDCFPPACLDPSTFESIFLGLALKSADSIFCARKSE